MLFDRCLNAQIVRIGVVIRTVVREEQCIDISVAVKTILLFIAVGVFHIRIYHLFCGKRFHYHLCFTFHTMVYHHLCFCSINLYAYIVFIIQMEGMKEFRPNDKTHRQFGDVLREASESEVKILAYECQTGADYMTVKKSVPVNIFYETI